MDDSTIDSTINDMMARVDINSNEMSGQALNNMVRELTPMELIVVIRRQESERNKLNDWEGLNTKQDQLKSQQFVNTLYNKRAVICPYCRTLEMVTINGYLICISCNIRFETNLSIEQIVEKIQQILDYHSTTKCKDHFPQFHMFKSNLTIYCNSCPFNHFIL